MTHVIRIGAIFLGVHLGVRLTITLIICQQLISTMNYMVTFRKSLVRITWQISTIIYAALKK